MVGKKIFKFVNDRFKISPSRRLENISTEDLESAFALSKNAILNDIFEDYNAKYETIVDKMTRLEEYFQSDPKNKIEEKAV